MEIENILSTKDKYMKKSLGKFIKESFKKIKEHKQMKKIIVLQL